MGFEQPAIFRTLELLIHPGDTHSDIAAMCQRARLNAEAILEVETRKEAVLVTKIHVYRKVHGNQEAPAWRDVVCQIAKLTEEEGRLQMENENMRRESLQWKKVLLEEFGSAAWADCEKKSFKEKEESRRQRKRKREVSQ